MEKIGVSTQFQEHEAPELKELLTEIQQARCGMLPCMRKTDSMDSGDEGDDMDVVLLTMIPQTVVMGTHAMTVQDVTRTAMAGQDKDKSWMKQGIGIEGSYRTRNPGVNFGSWAKSGL